MRRKLILVKELGLETVTQVVAVLLNLLKPVFLPQALFLCVEDPINELGFICLHYRTSMAGPLPIFVRCHLLILLLLALSNLCLLNSSFRAEAITTGQSSRAKLRSTCLDLTNDSTIQSSAWCETQLYPLQNLSCKVDIPPFQLATWQRIHCETNAGPHTLVTPLSIPLRNLKGKLNKRCLPLLLRSSCLKQQVS